VQLPDIARLSGGNVKRLDHISIRIPDDKLPKRLIERLRALGVKRDRPVNHLALEAILDYLKQEEEEE